ncbi:MAG: 30S ribosomal protein S20 [Clostridia bacterium]|nr:30S ribosomal protein S20 [Clostridia bacterium]
MPNIKSAKKRVKTIDAKTLQNKMLKTALKTSMKKYEAALEAGEKEVAAETYKTAVKKIDKAVAQGLLHKNTAARKKSQYTRKLNALNA